MLDNPWDLKTPVIYRRGRVFFTDLVPDANTRHSFGGDLGLSVSASPKGPRELHRVATLDLTDAVLEFHDEPCSLPLLYGFRDICEFAYSFSADAIKVEYCNRLSNDDTDWPYPGFPNALPRLGLRLREPVAATFEKFSELTWQGLRTTPDDLVVVVPSVEPYGGAPLWGEYGQGVQIIFSYSPSENEVLAVNQVD